MKNSAWMMPIMIEVTPIGTTSVTHQVAASPNRAMASCPRLPSTNTLPLGSTASGHVGQK